MALLGANGITNSLWEGNDFSALMDSIDGTQMLAFVPAMNVKMPPSAGIFLSIVWEAATIEPGTILGQTCPPPSIPEGFFGPLPETEPLNDRVAILGYENMTPITEVGTVSILFMIQTVGFLIFAINVCIHRNRPHNFTAERFKKNFGGMVLWGSFINLILIAWLPVLVSVFISVVGIQWEGATGAQIGSNIWALFMLNAWLIAPFLLFIIFMRNP